MEPITIILTALKAGAVAVAKVTADEAIKDAYQSLKALILRKFAGKPKDEMVLDEHEKDPTKTWDEPLKKALTETAADKDREIVEAAQHLMKLVNPQQTTMGKYNTQIAGDVIASAIGDQANVTNRDINLGSKQSEK